MEVNAFKLLTIAFLKAWDIPSSSVRLLCFLALMKWTFQNLKLGAQVETLQASEFSKTLMTNLTTSLCWAMQILFTWKTGWKLSSQLLRNLQRTKTTGKQPLTLAMVWQDTQSRFWHQAWASSQNFRTTLLVLKLSLSDRSGLSLTSKET